MENTNQTNTLSDVYSIITNRIIEQLEQGIVPWKAPWKQAGIPRNLISGRPYNGINIWLLASLNHTQNIFLSFKQLKSLGASVKKGERACPVVYWNWKEKKDEDTGEVKKKAFLRYYMVFNVEQCEGIPIEKLPVLEHYENDPVGRCEQLIEGYTSCPTIHFSGSKAFYDPTKDIVQMPHMTDFIDSSHYYGTLFHELIHSTGHQSRLNRKEIVESGKFGSAQYSQEELVAEMGATFLLSLAGIDEKPFDNQVAYIQHWLGVLKNDKRCIIFASGKAQQAVDYILGNLKEAPVEKESQIEEGVEQ